MDVCCCRYFYLIVNNYAKYCIAKGSSLNMPFLPFDYNLVALRGIKSISIVFPQCRIFFVANFKIGVMAF